MTDVVRAPVEATVEGRSRGPSFGRALAVIGALAFAWQAVFVLVWRRDYDPWGDAYFFYESGLLLADGLGWIIPLDYNLTGEELQAADHPPLYIVFLGFWSWLGITGVTAQMLLTSLFIGVPLVVVTGLAGREIGGPRLGLIAAVTVAFAPTVWVWQGTLLSEPLAMLGLVTVVWTAYRFRHRPSFWGAAAMGAALTFATFGRAELLLLSVVVVTPLILMVGDWTWLRRIGALFVAGAVCAGLLAPWVLFNMSRFEDPVYLSAGYEITLATANCDDTYYGPLTGYWSIDCYGEFIENAGLTNLNSDQSERSAALVDETFGYIGDHIDRLPTVLVARWMRITGLWKPIDDSVNEAFLYDRNLWATRLAALTWYPIAGAAIAGAFVLRRRRETILPLVGPLVVVFVTITITFAQNRYRASAEPAIVLLAAVAFERLWVGFRAILDDPEDRAASSRHAWARPSGPPQQVAASVSTANPSPADGCDAERAVEGG